MLKTIHINVRNNDGTLHMSPVQHALIDMTCVGVDQISDEEDIVSRIQTVPHTCTVVCISRYRPTVRCSEYVTSTPTVPHALTCIRMDQLSGVVNMLLAHQPSHMR